MSKELLPSEQKNQHVPEKKRFDPKEVMRNVGVVTALAAGGNGEAVGNVGPSHNPKVGDATIATHTVVTDPKNGNLEGDHTVMKGQDYCIKVNTEGTVNILDASGRLLTSRDANVFLTPELQKKYQQFLRDNKGQAKDFFATISKEELSNNIGYDLNGNNIIEKTNKDYKLETNKKKAEIQGETLAALGIDVQKVLDQIARGNATPALQPVYYCSENISREDVQKMIDLAIANIKIELKIEQKIDAKVVVTPFQRDGVECYNVLIDISGKPVQFDICNGRDGNNPSAPTKPAPQMEQKKVECPAPYDSVLHLDQGWAICYKEEPTAKQGARRAALWNPEKDILIPDSDGSRIDFNCELNRGLFTDDASWYRAFSTTGVYAKVTTSAEHGGLQLGIVQVKNINGKIVFTRVKK